MTEDEAIKVLSRLRTADNALQAARLVAVNAAMRARIGNVQTEVRQLIERCQWESQHTGPEPA